MNKDLAQRIVEGYESDPWYVKILGHLSLNDTLGANKAFLSFVQELPPTDANLYFFSRPAAVVDNHGNEITALSALGSKLIYHIDHVSGVHCICLPTSVVLEIIISCTVKTILVLRNVIRLFLAPGISVA